jgi:hypothetical protein
MDCRPFGHIDSLRFQPASKAFRFPRKHSTGLFTSGGTYIKTTPQGVVFIYVPLEGVSWNQIVEELRGWLDLKETVGA